MHTILEILNLSKSYLEKKKVKDARLQAEELIGEILGVGRLGLYMSFDKPLTSAELDKCREGIKRKGEGEPLQYILGSVKFFDCIFKINRHVLIPRHETEILVDKISKILKQQDLNGKILWDVCCGSGCLGISLKKKFPELTVILADISNEALAVAKENAELNGVQIEFLEGDLLNPFRGKLADFFVCNPPYISKSDYLNLEREVKDFEPSLALIGGDSGFEFYEKLALELPKYLKKQAKVWFEIGDGQASSISKLFSSPSWSVCQHECDWSGKERFFSLEFE